MDGLSKAGLVGAYLFVSRVLRSAIGKADLCVHHSINLLEIMLGAPKTASGKIYLLQILFFHIFRFMFCCASARQENNIVACIATRNESSDMRRNL